MNTPLRSQKLQDEIYKIQQLAYQGDIEKSKKHFKDLKPELSAEDPFIATFESIIEHLEGISNAEN